MVATPEYSLEIQAKVILALCALHNFIRVHDPDDLDDQDWQQEVEQQPPTSSVADLKNRVNRAERDHTILRQEKIAGDMWNDYLSRALLV